MVEAVLAKELCTKHKYKLLIYLKRPTGMQIYRIAGPAREGGGCTSECHRSCSADVSDKVSAAWHWLLITLGIVPGATERGAVRLTGAVKGHCVFYY